MHAIQRRLEGLRAVGCTRCVQCLEQELQKAKKKLRSITCQHESVFNTFNCLCGKIASIGSIRARPRVAERKERWRHAQRAIAEEKEASRQLQVKQKKLQELDFFSACKHAIKNFTLEESGKGANNAGGVKMKKTLLGSP